jgi:hypothetical protein
MISLTPEQEAALNDPTLGLNGMTPESFQKLWPYFTPAQKRQFKKLAPVLERLFAPTPEQIEAEGGRAWAKRFFPQSFSRDFTSYQSDFWIWGWEIQPDVYYRPRVECEPRGVGKSTTAETWLTSILARKRRRTVGYISGTDAKANQHFGGVKRKLENPELLKTYPHLKPQVQKYRNAFNSWSQDRLVTDGGQTIIPITLQGSNRGFKSEDDIRFDLLIFDDIDSLGESPDVIAKNLDLLKSEILLAGYANTLIVVFQNLIHRDSIVTQVMDHRADILSDRDFRGPYPLMRWYDAEKVDLPDGGKRWVITAGEPYDPAISIEYCESILNQIGKDLFDRECQQDVWKVAEDKDFREWDEVYHIITQSEMERGFRNVQLRDTSGFFVPSRWHVGRGFDWGCLPLDTEILTKDGWKSHDQLKVGESVAGYDWESSQSIVWTPLKKIVYKDSQPLVEMRTKSFRFVCTPDHAWIVKRRKRLKRTRDTYRRQNLDTISFGGDRSLIVAARCDEQGEIECSSAMAAVLGWLVTDGWTYRKKGKPAGAMLCQKNHPQAVIDALVLSGLEWKEVKPMKNGVRLFYLPASSFRRLRKVTGYTGKQSLSPIVTRLLPEARKAMLNAMLLAEGTNGGAKRKSLFCQQKGYVSDAFQILASLSGIRLGIQREHQSQWGTSHRIPLLRFQAIKEPRLVPIEGLHRTWCPSVSEGAVIARQRGQVTITGNSTRQHPSAVAYVTRPDKTCPHDDAHFVFAEVVAPKFPFDPSLASEVVSPGRVAHAIKLTERNFHIQSSQIEQSKMSHEASAAKNTLMLDLPKELTIFFNKWKAAKGSGVPQIQNMLEIDRTKEHPFRVYPQGHPHAGKPLMGRPRIYFVVADGQGELYCDGDGKLRVRGARDSHGLARCRYEMPLYSHRNAGKKKIDDDFVDALRGLMSTFGVHADALTESEELIAATPKKYRAETVFGADYTPEKEMSFHYQTALAKQRVQIGQAVTFDEFNQPVDQQNDELVESLW